MDRFRFSICFMILLITVVPFSAGASDVQKLLTDIQENISGERALDYTGRMWRYDKWSTLPMWQKTAAEVQKIMVERGFDEADIIDTPADGVTQYSTWTNPIGWDVTQATLVVTEPHDIPGEYRYLCSYKYNPTSLTFFSSPTPPEGVEAELVVLENNDPGNLQNIDANGKILFVSSGAGRFKKYLDDKGLLGIVSDQAVKDDPDANVWLNTWSDAAGGWLMNASDSRSTFGFSISKNKGDYLRKLISDGETVKVRAIIESKYFTDSTLPYVTGCIDGTDEGGEEVLAAGHMFEWGANDNCTGCSIMLESVGTLNDMIKSGILPRPKRTIRLWMGQEMYGSLAFTERYIDNLRRTVAALCVDTPAPSKDLTSSTVRVFMNPNVCPTFTDAVLPDMFRKYYSRTRSNKLVKIAPFMGGTDNYFCESKIGAPTNFIYMENGSNLHHTSVDTIDKVDVRSLYDLCAVTALYLYFMANAGSDDVSYMTDLTFDMGIQVILKKAREMKNRLAAADDGEALGEILYDGIKAIDYYTGLRIKALESILRIVPDSDKSTVRKKLSSSIDNTGEYGKLAGKQFREAVKEKSKSESIKVIPYKKKKGDWAKTAASIVPDRQHYGSLTLDGIPYEEWKDITRSPKWWSTRNWAASSFWWCDGKRNLLEIKELVELEAGRTMTNFDLVSYYSLLEKHNLVTFVK
ncbi:M28 family peptidase [Candidatus Latescibacterota bacterium]